MNALPAVERRAIPEARMAELRRLALSPDEAERKSAQNLLRQIEAQLSEREVGETHDSR